MKIITVCLKRYFLSLSIIALLGGGLMPLQVYAADNSAKKSSQAVDKASTRVNINRASIKDLMSLHGVGEQKATAIVKYRSAHGKFKTIDQLAEVDGIGAAIIEKNRKRLSL